jgi:predicted GIY-YIG superfamily endonuclease
MKQTNIEMNLAYVYKLVSSMTDKVYIGKTNNINRRMYAHKSHYKNYQLQKKYSYCASFEIVRYEDWTHKVVEICCEEKAKERERYWIKQFGSGCVNILESGKHEVVHRNFKMEQMTEEERHKKIIQDREYYHINKEDINSNSREKYATDTEYREHIKKANKTSRDKNKDKWNETRRTKTVCEFCGESYMSSNTARHLRTSKCEKYQSGRLCVENKPPPKEKVECFWCGSKMTNRKDVVKIHLSRDKCKNNERRKAGELIKNFILKKRYR